MGRSSERQTVPNMPFKLQEKAFENQKNTTGLASRTPIPLSILRPPPPQYTIPARKYTTNLFENIGSKCSGMLHTIRVR